MKYIKYDEKDLLEIKAGRNSVEDIANKYGVSSNAIMCAMSRARIYRKKKMILLTTPYETMICHSINECAEVVGVSVQTIINHLKKNNSRILKELNIKVEVYEPNYAEEEFDY